MRPLSSFLVAILAPFIREKSPDTIRKIISALDKYNRTYKQEIPKVTPHVCRHTFCSKMARSGMSPAKLKYIMGHSDIDTTFNVYTHLGFEDVREDMLRCLSDKTAA